jgi:hypothetical protein
MDKPVEIYAVQESGVSGSWEWFVSMSSNQDGTYRLVVDQVLWDGDEESEPASYELTTFNTGEQLFEFLQSTWQQEHGEGLEEGDWQAIETTIRKFDEHLANEVNRQSRTVFGHVEPVKSESQMQIAHCIEAATWEKSTYAGGGAMWAAIAERKKVVEAVSAYVRDYYAQKGEVPEGQHQVKELIVTFTEKSRPSP